MRGSILLYFKGAENWRWGTLYSWHSGSSAGCCYSKWENDGTHSHPHTQKKIKIKIVLGSSSTQQSLVKKDKSASCAVSQIFMMTLSVVRKVLEYTFTSSSVLLCQVYIYPNHFFFLYCFGIWWSSECPRFFFFF